MATPRFGIPAAVLLCLLGSTAARAQNATRDVPDWDAVVARGAQAILQAADEVEYGGRKNQTVRFDLRVYDDPNGEPRVQQCVMYELGERRVIKFEAPPDVAGTGVLIKDAATMYIYLPQYDRVRMVASSNRKQTFMGSDFSFDDMAVSKASPLYEASLVETNATGAVLDLAARPDAQVLYPRMRVTIAKPGFFTVRAEFFDENGRHVRTRLREKPKDFHGWLVSSVQTVIDHGHNDHRSELHFRDIVTNSPDVTEDLFTKRALVRGL